MIFIFSIMCNNLCIDIYTVKIINLSMWKIMKYLFGAKELVSGYQCSKYESIHVSSPLDFEDT